MEIVEKKLNLHECERFPFPVQELLVCNFSAQKAKFKVTRRQFSGSSQ